MTTHVQCSSTAPTEVIGRAGLCRGSTAAGDRRQSDLGRLAQAPCAASRAVLPGVHVDAERDARRRHQRQRRSWSRRRRYGWRGAARNMATQYRPTNTPGSRRRGAFDRIFAALAGRWPAATVSIAATRQEAHRHRRHHANEGRSAGAVGRTSGLNANAPAPPSTDGQALLLRSANDMLSDYTTAPLYWSTHCRRANVMLRRHRRRRRLVSGRRCAVASRYRFVHSFQGQPQDRRSSTTRSSTANATRSRTYSADVKDCRTARRHDTLGPGTTC